MFSSTFASTVMVLKKATRALLAAGILCVSSAYLAGEPIQLDDSKMSLLYGRWEGDLESSSTYGVYYDSVTLRIDKGLPLDGAFKMEKSGNEWRTGVVIRDGKAILGFGHASRKWTMERDSAGVLWLKVSYPSEFRGTPIDVTVKLKRK